MRLHLTKPESEKFVEAKVKAGYFATAESVVEDVLARMMKEELV